MQTRPHTSFFPSAALDAAPVVEPLLRVVVARDGGTSTLREFFHPIVTVGRGPAADLRLETDDVSRLHCSIEVRADGMWVRDLGSTNGVYMDGERVREAILTPKSLVRVGCWRFKARQESPLPAEREHTTPSAPIPHDPPLIRGTLETRTSAIPREPAAPAPTFTRPAPTFSRPAAVPGARPSTPPAPWAPSTPASAQAPGLVTRPRIPLPPKHRPVRAGDACAACHDGLVLTWGTELRCRRCWTDGNVKPVASARLGDRCPCCHRGTMLTWEGGLRCRSCGNRGSSARQPQPPHAKIRAGSLCPSCSERRMLTWLGSVRCHGCGHSYR